MNALQKIINRENGSSAINHIRSVAPTAKMWLPESFTFYENQILKLQEQKAHANNGLNFKPFVKFMSKLLTLAVSHKSDWGLEISRTVNPKYLVF